MSNTGKYRRTDLQQLLESAQHTLAFSLPRVIWSYTPREFNKCADYLAGMARDYTRDAKLSTSPAPSRLLFPPPLPPFTPLPPPARLILSPRLSPSRRSFLSRLPIFLLSFNILNTNRPCRFPLSTLPEILPHPPPNPPAVRPGLTVPPARWHAPPTRSCPSGYRSVSPPHSFCSSLITPNRPGLSLWQVPPSVLPSPAIVAGPAFLPTSLSSPTWLPQMIHLTPLQPKSSSPLVSPIPSHVFDRTPLGLELQYATREDISGLMAAKTPSILNLGASFGPTIQLWTPGAKATEILAELRPGLDEYGQAVLIYPACRIIAYHTTQTIRYKLASFLELQLSQRDLAPYFVDLKAPDRGPVPTVPPAIVTGGRICPSGYAGSCHCIQQIRTCEILHQGRYPSTPCQTL